MEISAKIVADSIMTGGHRLLTFELVYPFIIHGEVMTHRMFSRNAASARAIPYSRLEESVMTTPFIPIAYQQEHSGMQGSKYIDDQFKDAMDDKWLYARDQAVKSARNFNRELYTGDGVDTPINFIEGTKPTKQIANRILQPYTLMRVIVTTGYDEGLRNFLYLRDHPDAEIHIQKLAVRINEAVNKSTPIELPMGQWHIPYREKLVNLITNSDLSISGDEGMLNLIKASTGRVARISYTTIPKEGKIESYLRIHDLMVSSEPFHASAFEHVHRNMTNQEYKDHSLSFYKKVNDKIELVVENGWSKNTRGSLSYRTIIENKLPIF